MNQIKAVAIIGITTAVALNGFAQAAFVTIGDARNTNDNTTGYGGVAYEYQISEHEVTIAEFVASGAGDGNENLWNSGSYSVGPDAPATRISLYEAMKYCNWLTTGDTNSGYYSTSDGGATYQTNALSHDVYAAAHGTTYFIPTEDEWYKAAYWTGSGYSLYADGTSDTNNPPAVGGGTSGWNYNDVTLSPNYTRDVTLGTTEQNGTVNMMGNISEWMEDAAAVIRGGHYGNEEDRLRSSNRASHTPLLENHGLGFRPVVVTRELAAFVTIGDVGNADDASGYGGVDYEYKISSHEVTITEWDASGVGGQIDYWNDEGHSVGTNAPAVYISLYDAMKYCNWLTTGSTNSGYYSTSNGGLTYEANALSHDAYAAIYGTTYFVPTEDEWVKAAYWTGSGYSLYADGNSDTNNPPAEGGSASGWNYNDVNAWPNLTRDTTLGSTEQNGTVNMMGNVWEWMDDATGAIRGGGYSPNDEFLRSSFRSSPNPSRQNVDTGFRPVQIISPYVSIGDVGNPDASTGYGGVDYAYKISNREVTIEEFAASGAGDDDENFWNDGTRTVGLRAPASNVSLYEAMKYCNWLTSGNVNNGVYVFSGGVYQSTDRVSALFDYEKIYALPTENEWIKAAYWTGSGYSDYANGDDTSDGAPTEGGDATGWNYHYVNTGPNYTRSANLGTTEQNGTVNMMGNVDEWMEDATGVTRGGRYDDHDEWLSSSSRSYGYSPSYEATFIGFRTVEIVSTFVKILDVGNADDTTTGYGGVDYEYKISGHEVTIAEFTASGAGDDDEDYWNDETRTVGGGAPATQVSLDEAMRYCNWLTSGDVNIGYYSPVGGGVYQANALSHVAYAEAYGTTYFVPTEDEWFKAAYWGGAYYALYADGGGIYSQLPTAGGAVIGWNYNDVNTGLNLVRDTALGTTELNGTVNMMGNVKEWMEDAAGAVRGGHYASNENRLRSSHRDATIGGASTEADDIGFRPVVVEPQFVNVGDVGNADDGTIGYGGVDYAYTISKHEVTLGEFIASGAGDSNENYWNDGTRTVGLNAPATKVSLYEAMKYCNWLTTGDVNSGYYSTSDGSVYAANPLSHDAYAEANGTTYFVPTEDEWVKAAYWTGGGYSYFADGTGDFYNPPAKGGGATGWNYDNANSTPNQTRNTFHGTTEQNGTVNMMGNVAEWMEDAAGVIRGGNCYSPKLNLTFIARASQNPLNQNNYVGFRTVKVVADPATAPSLVMSGLEISWQSEAGQSYSMLTATNLTEALWAPVQGWPQSGTGGILIFTNTYTDSPRFFKVDT